MLLALIADLLGGRRIIIEKGDWLHKTMIIGPFNIAKRGR